MFLSCRNSTTKSTIVSFILITIIIITTNFFSYIAWNKTLSGRFLKIIDLLLIVYYFKYLTIIKNSGTLFFKTEISHILWFSLFSIIGGGIIHGIDPIDGITGCLDHAFILIYFFLHFNRIEEKHLKNIMLILSVIITLLLCLQQFTFPLAPFGLKSIEEVQDPNDIVEIRNGLIRFRIPSYTFLLFTIFFYWEQLSKRFQFLLIIPFGIALIGIYLLLTKQLMATVALTLFLSVFLIRNKKVKIISFILVIVLGMVGIKYGDILFGELFDSAMEQVSKDDIRVLSAQFFLNELFNNPIGLILGNGYIPELSQWGESHGYWVTDVGFIGETFLYGIIYISVYVKILFKIYKYRNYLPLYIKLYILSTFFISFMIFPYRDNTEFIIWAVLLYICDLHINKSTYCYPKEFPEKTIVH